MESRPEIKKPGHYLGTEIDEKWWKRYRKDKLFARGNGEFWLGEDGIYFRRYLTKAPIFIPFGRMQEIKLGKWHAGKWCAGRRVLKIVWKKDGLRLSSGFLVSGAEEVVRLKTRLEEQAGSSGVART